MDKFLSSTPKPAEVPEDALWFIFTGDHIYLLEGRGKHSIPLTKNFTLLENKVSQWYYIGSYEERHCYIAYLEEHYDYPSFVYMRLRKAYYVLDEKLFALAGKAFQTMHFYRRNKYCGECGGVTEPKIDEFSVMCKTCSAVFYPQQAPAVIVAITKKNKILLARAKRFPVKMYSVLAGFVEPGESLEDCIKREVREECGIEVKNIKYFGSQSWAFPNSLMVGFTAESLSGELKIDEEEIAEAGWYFYDNLPEIPDTASIARKLIDWFVNKQSKRNKE